MAKGFTSKLVTVTVRDRPLQLIMATIAADPELEVEAGLLDTDSDIAAYGWYNEFGTKTIPARSFIRSTFDSNKAKYLRQLEGDLQKALRRGRPLKAAMVRLGNEQRNDIVKKITSLRVPPNDPATIAQKGSSNPLIDTGIMRATIRFRVKKS